MSVGTFNLYNTGKEALLTDNSGQIDWVNDTVVAVLLTEAYTPALTHSQYSSVSANLAAGATPVVITSKTAVRTNGVILWDCADINFGSNVTTTAKYCVLIKRVGASLASTDQLIGYVDLNTTSTSATVSSTDAVFQLNTSAGLFEV